MLALRDMQRATDRIAAIPDCHVLVEDTDLDAKALRRAIDRFILSHRGTPSGTFMVGTHAAHLHAAEDAGLALFLWARDYFGATN